MILLLVSWIRDGLLLLLILCFLGFLSYIIGRAPFIDAGLKSILRWVLLIPAGFFVFDYLWMVFEHHHLMW